jgi:putative peptidoglycan lipid II flippase
MSSSKSSVLGLSTVRMVRLVVSLATIAISAKFFGTSIERDLWILAITAINFIQASLWGPINETFRAKFIFIKEEEGEYNALKKAKSLFLFTILVTIFVLSIYIFFHYKSATLIALGNSEAEQIKLDFILQILAPSLLLTQITLLLSSILNAYGIFYMPEITGLIASLLNIFIFYFLVSKIGIYSLAVAHYASLVILLGMLIFQIRKQQIPFFERPFTLNFRDVKPFILFASPFFIAYFFAQLNGISEKSIASLMGTGKISIIDYARKFIDIPMGVLYSVLNTIMIPILTTKFMNKDLDGFKKEFSGIFQLGILILGVFFSILIMGSSEIVNIAYNLGKIDAESLKLISHLSIIYGFSTIMIFCFSILGLSLVSLQKNKTYAIVATAAHIIIIILNIAFFKQFDIYIFPLSLSLAYTISAITLMIKFHNEVGALPTKLIKYLCFIIILSTVNYLGKVYLFSYINTFDLILLFMKSLFILSTTMVLIFGLKMDERLIILSALSKIKIYISHLNKQVKM